MTYWLVVPLLGLSAWLQVTAIPLLAIAGWKLDLPLLIIVAWGLLAPPGEAGLWGFAAGVFLDLLSGLPFGIHTFALSSVGLLMGLTQTTIFATNVVMPPAAMVLATFGYDVVALALLNTIGVPVAWDEYFLYKIIPTALLNTLALPIVYFPLQRLHSRLYPQIEW